MGAVRIIPALLASLASSVLPVSNLTNLIAVQRIHASIGDFMTQLALPSAIAIAVGGAVHLRHLRRAGSEGGATTIVDEPVDRRALRIGIPIVIWLIVGFTFGHQLSIEPWIVASIALVGLMALRRDVPWRAVPIGAIAIATGLGIAAAGAAAGAAAHLPVDQLLVIRGVPGELATFGTFAIGASAINNLPVAVDRRACAGGTPRPPVGGAAGRLPGADPVGDGRAVDAVARSLTRPAQSALFSLRGEPRRRDVAVR